MVQAKYKQVFYLFIFACLPIFSYAELPVACVQCTGGVNSLVSSGSATYFQSADGITGTINQESERAILNWQSFNIGRGNVVNFVQPSKSSTALNRIFQDSPSQIFGSLNANGQVLLINNNGIVFQPGSQVNVGGLVASTLNVSDEVFLNSNIAQALESGLAAFDGGSLADAQIVIEVGANLKSIEGGRIFVFAPNVINKGTIETPGGQTILAAAEDRVFLYQADSGSGIRGLFVELDTGGDVENIGNIIAERGNITLIGQAVRQAGSLSATTSVRENGSIRLLARDGARIANANTPPQASNTGKVILDKDSQTVILPDYKSNETANDVNSNQVTSTIEILGKTVVFKNNSLTRATGGEINVVATNRPASTEISNQKDDSRILVEPGALLDVSGDDTTVASITRNELEILVTANEVADQPVQKDGPIPNQRIKIDARFGTELADVSSALNSIERSAAERLSIGGTVGFRSDGDVIFSQDSTVDISGGQVNYTEGFIQTSRLAVGQEIVNVTAARGARNFDEMLASFTGNFVPNHIEGKDAGRFTVTTHDAILEGTIIGEVTRGIFQRELPRSLNDTPAFARAFGQAPELSSFLLDVSANTSNVDIEIANTLFSDLETNDFSTDQILADNHIVKIAPSLINNSGLGHFSVNTTGEFLLQTSSNLSLPAGGSFNIDAAKASLNSSIVSNTGAINISTTRYTSNPGVDGSIIVSSGVRLDTSGAWINDFADTLLRRPTANVLKAIDGGSVNLDANGDLLLASSSVIDVSGSGYLDAYNNLTAGVGGEIGLATNLLGSDTNFALNGSLRGYGIETGGKLSLEGNGFVVNSTGVSSNPNLVAINDDYFSKGGFGEFEITANRYGLEIDSSARISPVMSNLVVSNSARLLPTSLNTTGNAIERSSIIELLPSFLRNPVSLSFTSEQSTLSDVADITPDLVFEAGAQINLDVGGDVALTSDNSLYFGGVINAPSGDVVLNIVDPKYTHNDLGFLTNQAIWLGSNSRIDVSGGIIETPNFAFSSFSEKQVFDAGSISLNTERGYIVGLNGSELDVRGISANGVVQKGMRIISLNDYSDSGSIKFSSGEGILVNSRLLGRAADARASYGSIEYELKPSLFFNAQQLASEVVVGGISAPDDTPRIIELSNVDADLSFAIGADIPTAQYNGRAPVNVNRLQSQFDNVSFKTSGIASSNRDTDRISLVDNVELSTRQSISLSAPLIDARSFDNVLGAQDYSGKFSSNYILFGPTGFAQQDRTPNDLQDGQGILTLNASIIDLIGDSSVTNFSDVIFTSNTDVRFRAVRTNIDGPNLPQGSLTSGGDIQFNARQIYPTTLTEFTVKTEKENGTIEVNSSGSNPQDVLSVAGKLTLDAANIVNRGVIKAPGGELNLNASNSLKLLSDSTTSVSLDNQIVPFGRTQAGEYVYIIPGPGEGNDLTVVYDRIPEKTLSLNSTNIEIASGSVVNTSGGGDILAYEHVPGPSGTLDILNSELFPEYFAIVPSLDINFAPSDYLESEGAGLSVGDQIVLAVGMNGLPAGTYTLLPARYAILGPSYLIKPNPEFNDILPDQSFVLADGSMLIPGQRAIANTSIIDSTTQGFSVIPSASLDRFVQVDTSTATHFFSEQARLSGSVTPPLSRDAGILNLIATETLSILGDIRASAVNNGRGGLIDIQADKIAIVNSADDAQTEGFLSLVAGTLESAASESILIGGSRSRGIDGVTNLNILSSEVIVSEGVSISGNELIFAATDSVTVDQAASVNTNTPKNSSSPAEHLVLNGDGAMIRVSSNNQVSLARNNSDNQKGELVIAENSVLNSSNSVTLDSSKDFSLLGNIVTNRGSLGLSANSIVIGENNVPNNSGLAINAEQIGVFDFNELALTSQNSIDFAENTSLALNNLVLDTPEITGSNNSNTIVNVSSFTLKNSSEKIVALDPTIATTSSFVVNSQVTSLDDAIVAVNGVQDLKLNASQSFSYMGTNELAYGGESLTINTPLITGVAKSASLAINAESANTSFISTGVTSQANAVSNSIGANLNLLVNNFVLDTAIINHAGSFTVKSNENIALQDRAIIDVSGVTRDFIYETKAFSGGQVKLSSNNGDISASNGSVVNISAPSIAANAGSFVAQATNSFSYDGNLFASANESFKSGNVTVTANQISDLALFNQELNDAGAFNTRSIRVTGDGQDIIIGQGEIVKSSNVLLVADQGSVIVEDGASIDASGVGNRDIYIAASDEVRFDSGSLIDASATEGSNQQGGELTIEVASTDGELNLIAGSEIDLAGDGDGLAGKINAIINVDTSDNSSLLANRVDLSFSGITNEKSLSIVSVTQDADITEVDVNTAVNNLTSYIDNNIAALLSEVSDLKIIAAPEIQGAQLSTSGVIDLSGQRYTNLGSNINEPITLTLRSSSDLIITNDISDGFDSENKLINENSSSINLIAGADITSAYKFATNQDAGNLVFSNSATTTVRTGTGDIQLHSGGDLNLGSGSVYTAGINAGRGTFPEPTTGGGFGGGSDLLREAQFGRDGGDIAVNTKGDFIAEVNSQNISDYLYRFGDDNSGASGNRLPTVQGINFDGFNQGIGLLGGGDFTAEISGDSENLTVSIPTVIQHQGDFGIPFNFFFQTYTDNSFEIFGGGNLDVDVGGNLIGSNLYIENGIGNVNVGGDIGTGKIVEVGVVDSLFDGLILALGDSSFDISASGDVNLDAIVNPSLLPQVASQVENEPTLFVTYTSNSKVAINSTNGDINFRQDSRALGLNSADPILLVPGLLEFTSAQGDIVLFNDFSLSPSASGGLRFFAGDNLTTGLSNQVNAVVSDANPDFFPSLNQPSTQLDELVVSNGLLALFDEGNSSIPIHINDMVNSALVALKGDIAAGSDDAQFSFRFAEAVDVFAGNNIINPNFNIQHSRADNISTVQALGEIIFPSARSSIGALVNNNSELAINGPGRLDIISGRGINLGSSLGVVSNGNTENPFLAGPGADITLLVGASLDKSYDVNVSSSDVLEILDNFATGDLGRQLLENGIEGVDNANKIGVIDNTSVTEIRLLREKIVNRIVRFAEQKQGPGLSQQAAFAVFDSAPQIERREIFTSVIFDVLSTSTVLAATSLDDGINRESFDLGFGIIESLFPQAELVSANLSLFNSRILSEVGGGDINIIVPGGEIDVGLASVVPGTREDTSSFNLGIVSKGIGGINVYARGDVNINSSRIFATGGGDVLAASALGDVDAGRGPRTSVAPLPPVTEIVNGIVVTTFPPAISGNGILVSSSDPNVESGDAFFWIPNGVLDAGSAGIDIGGGAFFTAPIVNAPGVDVGGSVSGTQLSDSGPPVGLTSLADSTSAGVSDSVEKNALGDSEKDANKFGEQALKWLEVFVLGFGDEDAI